MDNKKALLEIEEIVNAAEGTFHNKRKNTQFKLARMKVHWKAMEKFVTNDDQVVTKAWSLAGKKLQKIQQDLEGQQ